MSCENKLTLVKTAIDEWMLGELDPTKALGAISAIVYNGEVTLSDIEWAKSVISRQPETQSP